MHSWARRALIFYVCLTAAALASFLVVRLNPAVSLPDIYEEGTGTFEPSLIVSLFVLWCLAGGSLWWASRRRLTPETLVLFVGTLAVSLLYLSIMREHVWFGDYQLYFRAAKTLEVGAAMTPRYVYPPFWAFLLLNVGRAFGGGPVGDHAIILFCFALNHFSVVGFFLLGAHFLSRCGLSRALSAMLLFAAVAVNVPVLRNMVYVQVNLLLLDLVLAGVLVLRKSVFLSALLFGLATHLKVTPLLLVPVFVYRREFRWLAYYGLVVVGIGWLTTLSGGWEYYAAFVRNLLEWHPAAYRSSSFYGFFKRTGMLFGASVPYDALFNALRAALAAGVYALSYLSMRREVFARGPDDRSAGIVNGLVPLLFVWIVVSPTVWPYHLVVLIIPAVLSLTHMRRWRRLGLWTFGYVFTFIVPVFDFYPWSYLRLAGWLALLAAMSDVVIFPRTADWITRVDEAVNEALSRVASRLPSLSGTAT
jgi:hypothetical protein